MGDKNQRHFLICFNFHLVINQFNLLTSLFIRFLLLFICFIIKNLFSLIY